MSVDRVICSGSGCLRLLVYLQAQDRAVAVDSIEARRRRYDVRPYALANEQFKAMPVFGEFRGHDNPELIAALEPQPQVIFKTYAGMGQDPQELEQKTGIPVVVLNYGNLGRGREHLYKSLRIMGQVLGRSERAEQVIGFFEEQISQLQARIASAQKGASPRVFVGGVAFKGPHGFQSTEPFYPPFEYLGAVNVAQEGLPEGKELRHSIVAKEKIMEWDPDVLFVDLSSLQMGEESGAVYELQTDPAYKALSAVAKGQVYGVLPYNSYTQNFGSILADAWFIGSVLYPEVFADVDAAAKADEMYRFLVGKSVFSRMDECFGHRAFKPLDVQ